MPEDFDYDAVMPIETFADAIAALEFAAEESYEQSVMQWVAYSTGAKYLKKLIEMSKGDG